MTVTPAVRLLVVTDDSLFSDYTTAAVDRYPDMTVSCVSTLSRARSQITDTAVDCVVLDTDLSHHGTRGLHRAIRTERPTLPVVLASDRPRSQHSDLVSHHAFVHKTGPAMGTSLADVVRVLTTASPFGGHDTASATAE